LDKRKLQKKILMKTNSLQLVHPITKKNIKNGTHRFVTGLSREFYFKEVNDTNDFEASKQGRTIEWE